MKTRINRYGYHVTDINKMKTRINRLLNRLKVEYAVFWVLCLLLMGLYETDVLPQGVWAGDVRMEYIFQTVGILLAVAFIPLSLRVFSLSLTRYVCVRCRW